MKRVFGPQRETKNMEIGKGVQQGSCMSPKQFNLQGEQLIKEASERDGNFGRTLQIATSGAGTLNQKQGH